MGLVLIIILILLICGGLPNVGFVSHSYGYGPSGLLGVVLIVLIVLLVMGRL
jgi:hypothetical protein